MTKNIKVVEYSALSRFCDKRYVVVDADTGEVLDDAQGYGYKTVRKAYAAYYYKHKGENFNVGAARREGSQEDKE